MRNASHDSPGGDEYKLAVFGLKFPEFIGQPTDSV
jgi:hypothetical protein